MRPRFSTAHSEWIIGYVDVFWRKLSAFNSIQVFRGRIAVLLKSGLRASLFHVPNGVAY